METMALDPKVKACPGIAGMRLMIFGNLLKKDEKVIHLCCEAKEEIPEIALADSAEETLERLIGMRHMLLTESMKYCDDYSLAGAGPLVKCLDCAQFQPNYKKGYWTFKTQIDAVNFGMIPSPCQSRCIYCTGSTKWENDPHIMEQYEKVFRFVQLADDTGLIDPNARWFLTPGEISIHPFKQRFYEIVKGKRTAFYSNCMVFDNAIATHLHEAPGSYINFSIDAGTKDTWLRIKGLDNFDAAVDHFKHYCASAADLSDFCLKYILMPGINDASEDWLFVMKLLCECGLKKLTISRDHAAKYQHDAEFHAKLIEAATRLSLFCCENGITPRIFNYSQGEKQEIEQKVIEEGYKNLLVRSEFY